MSDDTQMPERAAFEWWAEARGACVVRMLPGSGVYNNPRTQSMWLAWQAGRAEERERCAKLCEQEHAESGEHPEMALHCAERIRGLRA